MKPATIRKINTLLAEERTRAILNIREGNEASLWRRRLKSAREAQEDFNKSVKPDK